MLSLSLHHTLGAGSVPADAVAADAAAAHGVGPAGDHGERRAHRGVPADGHHRRRRDAEPRTHGRPSTHTVTHLNHSTHTHTQTYTYMYIYTYI